MDGAKDMMSALGNTPTRLRQIALVTADLAKAEQLLVEVLGTEVIFVDPGVATWGLKNILVAIGGDLIEVVAPFRDGTTAGRLLQKRGEGGYMIIMQTHDAKSRRRYLESSDLAKVIYGHEPDGVTCVQYHPKGIPGGMMPELDSHSPTPDNPTPLSTVNSPWHACGKDYASYSAGMKRCNHLSLVEATCRLDSGEEDVRAAVRTWEKLFGVESQEDELLFTNASLKFVEGIDQKPAGLVSLTIAVSTQSELNDILQRAGKHGVRDGTGLQMLGIQWNLVVKSASSSKL